MGKINAVLAKTRDDCLKWYLHFMRIALMDDLADFILTRPPTAARPLLGLTVLVVEDSRFACEAVRLLAIH